MKKYFLSFLLVTLTATACYKDSAAPAPEDEKVLSLASVKIIPTTTKSIITGTFFSESVSANLGLFLTGTDGVSPYDGKLSGYTNVQYSKPTQETEWSSITPIKLSEAPGLLFGYYPYNESNRNLEAIEIKSSLNGNDYMYAVTEGTVSSGMPNAELELLHALARITVTIVRDASYIGTGYLSAISLSGEGIASSGTINLKNGYISANAETVSFPELRHSFNPEGKITEECLIVPAVLSDLMQTVKLRCVIDGKEYILDLYGAGKGNTGIVIKQGVHTSITLTIKSQGLSVSGISIGDWDDSEGTGSEGDLNPTGRYSIEGEDGEQGNL